jgi:predicted CoA-binding protein
MWDTDRAAVADLIEVQEGRSPVPLLDDRAIAALLRSRPRIAIVGASPQPYRASNGVLHNLLRLGYDVVAVNPSVEEIDGLPCYPSLATAIEATGPVDVVDVFRRADQCVAHAREAVAARAKILWLQLGIANLEAGRIAHEAGLGVVMDRCTSIEAGRLAARGPESG